MIIANMHATPLNSWTPRLAAFVVAMLLAGSVVYWVLQWPRLNAGSSLPPSIARSEPVPVNPVALARLLGADAIATAPAAMPDAASRFRLTGVIASGEGRGIALIAIDGKAPRPYRVGSVVEEGLVLQSVERRLAVLGAEVRGPERFRLELPVPAR
jgi:general secretion pathway protein C